MIFENPKILLNFYHVFLILLNYWPEIAKSDFFIAIVIEKKLFDSKRDPVSESIKISEGRIIKLNFC